MFYVHADAVPSAPTGELCGAGNTATPARIEYLHAHAAFPQKDPRIAETLGVYVPPLSESAAKH